jgi:hypothetical protein
VILERLGRQNPLGLTKLGSIFGSIERIFGLSIAARIDSFKVCQCNLAIPTPLGAGVSNKAKVIDICLHDCGDRPTARGKCGSNQVFDRRVAIALTSEVYQKRLQ